MGRLYETSGGAAGITRFLYDGDEPVAEYSGSGAMLRRYVHGSGNDDPMAWFEGESIDANVAKLIKTNHQGSVIALTDGQGNLTDINSYDEWGIPAPTNTGRFQYTGQAWIPELRMYHYKARIYSPTLGRFLQTDPIGYDDQVNLYAYVGNDPVNLADPTGMCTGGGSQCFGLWSQPAFAPAPSNLDAYNNHFRNGNGADYPVDPSESNGLEKSIDIGAQIQQSITGGGAMSGIAKNAYTNIAKGPYAFSLPDKDWSFNPSIASEAGQTVGRFTGTITDGTMQISTDGSYVVRGQMTLNLGEYNFNLDGRNEMHNALIWLGGKYAGNGVSFLPIANRTYNFTATGRYRP